MIEELEEGEEECVICNWNFEEWELVIHNGEYVCKPCLEKDHSVSQ